VTIDTSALIAILFDEPERLEFTQLVSVASRKLISTVSILEATIVLECRKGEDGVADLDAWLRKAAVRSVDFDSDQLELARRASHRFGKGRHPAALNFGDCASYALSQWSGEPLLFKGNDFTLTDVLRVRS